MSTRVSRLKSNTKSKPNPESPKLGFAPSPGKKSKATSGAQDNTGLDYYDIQQKLGDYNYVISAPIFAQSYTYLDTINPFGERFFIVVDEKIKRGPERDSSNTMVSTQKGSNIPSSVK